MHLRDPELFVAPYIYIIIYIHFIFYLYTKDIEKSWVMIHFYPLPQFIYLFIISNFEKINIQRCVWIVKLIFKITLTFGWLWQPSSGAQSVKKGFDLKKKKKKFFKSPPSLLNRTFSVPTLLCDLQLSPLLWIMNLMNAVD